MCALAFSEKVPKATARQSPANRKQAQNVRQCRQFKYLCRRFVKTVKSKLGQLDILRSETTN